jgi:ferredoxin-NADP reductase
MLKYLLDTQERRDIIVFYAVKNINEIAYRDVLSAAQAKIGVKVFYILTDKAALPRNWTGFAGRINEQTLMHTMPDYQERVYYLSGPPNMVKDHEEILKTLQIRSRQIKKDFFPGLV